ncbi:MAG: S9 family peptidase, partial [bacterium]
LWVIPTTGGEARQICKTKGGVDDPQWAPDGRRILFAGADIDEPKGKNERSDVKVIRRIFYKLNGEGFFHNRRQHLFVVTAEGGKPKQLTQGEFDCGGARWSPDGRQIAFIANLSPDADLQFMRDVFVMPAGGGKRKQITKSKGPMEMLAWSPDGKTLTTLGHDMHKSFSTNSHLWTIPARGGALKDIMKRFPRGIENSVNADCRVGSPNPGPVWAPDGRRIFFYALWGPACHVHSVDVASGRVERITRGKYTVDSYSFSKDGKKLAYTRMSPTYPNELWLFDGKRHRQIAELNSEFLSKVTTSKPEYFKFKASDGEEIDGWIIRPPGLKPRRKAPAILQIHGGPRTAYGHGMSHEFQFQAASGFAIFYCNPRGSAGYGEDFAHAVANHYGDRDYQDIMECVKYVTHRYKFVDPKRIGVTGGSYGGFMTNWIVGHTARFAAAVTRRSISNFYSFYGTSDIGYFFDQEEITGRPWDNTKEYLKRSPITYVEKVKTPLLIIHAEQDFRCPIEQGEQMFVALKRLKKEVEFVRFPDETHELTRSGKPKHREENQKIILNWFKKHLTGK